MNPYPEEDIEEDRLSQDGNTSNTASEYEHRSHRSEFSSEQSSDSEISEEEVTEPPQKRQRKDSRTPNTIMLEGTASTPRQPLGTPTAMQPGAAATSLGTPTAMQPGAAATALTQRVGAAGGPTAPTQFSAETLKDVRKCKNFLSKIIKLALREKHSSETTATVKELVKNLLDAKIEAEEFTSRVCQELNISLSQSVLPFLKGSLPALRRLTPDSSAFIQQCQLPTPTPQSQLPPPPPLRASFYRPPLRSSLTGANRLVQIDQSPMYKKKNQLEEVKQQLADREEHLRAKDKELEETKEQAQQTQEEMKAELQCGVCAGLFIEPVILNCTHSFCTYCIRKCKNKCPLCREPVQYQTRNQVLVKCMERIVQRLSPDEKAMRHREITERAANQDETRETPDRMEESPAQDMLSSSQDVVYLHASVISPIAGVYSNSPGSPYVNSPAYSNMPTPQSVSSTASENEEPSRSWRP